MSKVSSAESSLLDSPDEKIQGNNSSGDSDSSNSPVDHHDIFGSDTESEKSVQSAVPLKRSASPPISDPSVAIPEAAVSTRAILGSSSSDSDSENNVATGEKHDNLSLASSDGESILGSKQRSCDHKNEDTIATEQVLVHELEPVEEEPDEIRITADFPLIRADLGKEMHLVKMPNFLSVETRPFDPDFYEGELDEDEVLDEEGRTRLKLKVENTIRWRYAKNDRGDVIHESNSRVVRWSDGSLSLHLGDEIFDVHKMDIQSDFNHLFIREDRGLQGQAIFRTKLSFRPHSTDSFTHRKMTLSLADKTSKSQKVKILPVAGADPESNRILAIRKEEERLRMTLRRESQQRRMQERQLAAASVHRNRRSTGSFSGAAGYDSLGDSDGEFGGTSVSLGAIKRNAKASIASSSRPRGRSVSDSDDASVSDLSDTPRRKKARISDEDESN
uniref:RNA polymerase-associated protein LEO1 n=1 Tax=Mesocestoides corti TaxID=53468 RepID=A0A5K3FMT2_MESCO